MVSLFVVLHERDHTGSCFKGLDAKLEFAYVHCGRSAWVRKKPRRSFRNSGVGRGVQWILRHAIG